MASLLDKIKKNTTIKFTDVASNSKFFREKDMVRTGVPAVNIALSGRVDGGITPGLTVWAGPSRHFKTAFALLMAKSYLDKYPDAILLFYDSEFGTPKAYFDSFRIDMSRVVHSPILDIEELKHDIMNQLQQIERGDKIMIVIDSIGNLASRKEVEDAIDGKSVADMTRAKQLKSLFRMVTPHLNIKDIPMVIVAHTYATLEMFSKQVVGGGTGTIYAADNIYIIGRQQDKPTAGSDKGKLLGYDFIINVEKSRYVREKSKIPINVTFEGGINRFSGLIELALEAELLVEGKVGRSVGYSRVNADGEIEEAVFKEEATNNAAFWTDILASEKFNTFIYNKYAISHKDIISEEDDVNSIKELSEIDEDE